MTSNKQTRTQEIIEQLICKVGNTDKLIDCINCLIGNYYKNCEELSVNQINDLYELEQSKRFFMYLKKEILINKKL